MAEATFYEDVKAPAPGEEVEIDDAEGHFPRNLSESTFGPSPSENGFPAGESFINNQKMTSVPSNFSIGRPESVAGSIMEEPEHRRNSHRHSQRIVHTFSEATLDAPLDDDYDDTESVAASELTVTRTINKVEDFTPENPPEVGTVLEEEAPKPVELMVEFLGGDVKQSGATREYIDALYTEPMELSVECQFLPKIDVFSNTDPFCVLYMRDQRNSPWKELGTTEKLVNCHFPRFVNKFQISAQPDIDMDKELLSTEATAP